MGTSTSKLGYHLQTESLAHATPNPRRMRSTFTIFSNGSIIPPGFKFMELHALTLAARSYALLEYAMQQPR